MNCKLKKKLPSNRTFEQIRNHYEVERAIATRLKKTIREGRKIIYQTMYDELFKQVPDHPRLKRREDPEMTALASQNKLKLIEKFIDKSTIFVEFAPGDCRFAINICNRVRFVYGVDISDQRGQLDNVPDNFELIIYDGYDLQMQENSTDVVCRVYTYFGHPIDFQVPTMFLVIFQMRQKDSTLRNGPIAR